MKKLLYITIAAAAFTAACGNTESAIEKYQVDYYPEVKGIKIAEVKAENDFVTTEKELFYDNPHTTYLLELTDPGEYNISLNLTVTAHCVSAYGQGACFYVSPLVCLYTIDSIETCDSIYVDNNHSDTVYVNNVLYIRDSAYSPGNLYVNNYFVVNDSRRVIYVGEMINVTTLINTSEMVDVHAVSMSKSVVHAIDSQHINTSKKVLVPQHGVTRVAFEIASDMHTAQCYASNAAGGVGYAVIYIEQNEGNPFVAALH
ncbi:MAG: hypothetical protein LBH84_03690 [Prevotellaceae bacterium]|jgi:hypothetical protein|nr:hypothetical protein [Prevotellaceae bacterium]